MKIYTETDRLILREVLPEDADAFFELDSDPEVHRYLGNKPVHDKQQSIDVIKSIRQQYIENGVGRWAIIEKATNNFVGWTGLKLVKEVTNNHVNFYDVGYRLIRQYWGQGIATETALASLAYGFDVLKLDIIYGAAHTENKASNRILTKVGLTFVETFYYEGEKDNWYKIDRHDWAKAKAGQ